MAKLSITWLGHATFILRTPGGMRLILDPWIATNPSCPAEAKRVGHLDLVLVTHGHFDHTADVVSLGRESDARVVAPFELSDYFQRKGLRNVVGMNPGGTLQTHGLSVTMVPAVHSSSIEEDGKHLYAGLATGYVLTFEDGLVAYYAGDTAVFSDMRLIAEMYRPSLAFLPVGDLFTMGPEQAAVACDLLRVAQVVPMHWGTFPALTGTPARLRELVSARGVEVLDLKPGETTE
ncbi:MAG TPA: metal-dependent hydrolase [Vicinamibacterales bacterium]|nr:metal-dependent hydrolase [Vicinamibacterales bacterium]